jgi:hypothetical protein
VSVTVVVVGEKMVVGMIWSMVVTKLEAMVAVIVLITVK